MGGGTNEVPNQAPNMAGKHRSGLPKKLKAAEVSKIKKMARPGLTATAAAQRLQDHGALNISMRIVARIWRSERKKTFLEACSQG